MTEQTRNFDDDTLPEGFGKTNYSATRYETWRLKDDSSLILGFFPPMKSLLKSNQLFEFWTNHWGWAGQNGDVSKKPFQRPFLCLCEKNFGMVIKECAVCNLRKKYLDRVEAIKVRGKELGKDDAACKQAAAKELEWLRVHGVDSKCRLYAYNKSGQVGILEIPYSLAKKLKEEMKTLTSRHYPGTEKSINPTGRVGVFFEFTRTGKASPQSDKVTAHTITKTVQGEEAQFLDLYRIPDELLSLAQEVLPDLYELRDRQKINDEQALALVRATEAGSGSVEPQVVDSILGIRTYTPVEATEEAHPVAVKKAAPVAAVDDTLFGEPLPPKSPGIFPTPQNIPPQEVPINPSPLLFPSVAQNITQQNIKAAAKLAQEKPTPPATAPVATDSDFDSLFA